MSQRRLDVAAAPLSANLSVGIEFAYDPPDNVAVLAFQRTPL